MNNNLTHALTALFLVLSLGFITACQKSGADAFSPESIAKISTHEKAAEVADGLLGKILPILEGITDQDSANAAATNLAAFAPSFEAMDATMKRLGDPSPEKQKAIQAKLKNGDKFAEVMMGFLAKPELFEIISKAMPKM